MTAPTLHTAAIHVATAPAATSNGGGHGAVILALILFAALVYGIAHRISIHRYPFKNCPDCGGSGRDRAPFFRAHRACTRCGGSGEQLRRYAKKPQ